MNSPAIIANGKDIEANLPCTLEEFLVSQKLRPRSVQGTHLTIIV